MDGISVLIRKNKQETKKKKTERRLSPETVQACTLMLDFPASRTVKNNICGLSHLFYGIFDILTHTD